MLETKRLIIRKFKETDLADFIELTSNEKVCEMCNWPYFTDREILRHSLKSQITKPLNFAVVIKKENKVIGAIELFKYKNEENTKEIAFMLNENYWNQGIMTEAIDAVVKYAFDMLKLKTIIGGYFNSNIASYKVQKKVGFKISNKQEVYEDNKVSIRMMLQKDDLIKI